MTNNATDTFMELYWYEHDRPSPYYDWDMDCDRAECPTCGLPKDAHKLYRGQCFACREREMNR